MYYMYTIVIPIVCIVNVHKNAFKKKLFMFSFVFSEKTPISAVLDPRFGSYAPNLYDIGSHKLYFWVYKKG